MYERLFIKDCLIINNNPIELITTEFGRHIFVSEFKERLRKKLKNAKHFSVIENDGKIILNIYFNESFVSASANIKASAESIVERINRELPEYERISEVVVGNT